MQKLLSPVFLLLFAPAAFSQNGFEEGKNIFKNTDSANVIRQWMQYAVSLSETDSAGAVAMFEKAIAAAERNGGERITAEVKMKFASFLYDKGVINRSFQNYLNARQIYSRLNAPEELAVVTMGLAKTQYLRGNYRPAIRSFLEAVTLSKQLDINEMEAEASEYLGLLYNVSQNFPESIRYFLLSYDIKNKTGDAKGMVRMAGKLSELYYDNRKFDSSFYYASVSLQKSGALNLNTDIYQARLAKAAALIRLNRWKEAEEELKILTEIRMANKALGRGDVNFLVKYNVVSGNYFLARNEVEKGNNYYDSALKAPNRNRSLELFAYIYKNMAESWYEAGDFKKAYSFYKQYSSSLQGLLSSGFSQNAGDMEALLDADRSKDEIKLLSIENRLKQVQLLREAELRQTLERENMLMDSIILQEKNLTAALSRENNLKASRLDNEKKLRVAEASRLGEEKKMRLSLLVGLGTALLLGAVIFYQYRKQRQKNIIIRKQAEELQSLIKEIHHRVKNNLQVVSSLLNLQSLYIKDREGVDAVKDSRNRVLSMALIHQSLYQEGDLQSVHVPDYINKLCDSLFSSYNISPEKIKLVKQIQPLTVNMETLIPVGLILNELITNSLKYAFPQGREGIVTITVKEETDALLLQVEDDGVGLPTGFNADENSSFGLKMIHSFLQKLKGRMQISSDNGTKAVVFIKTYQ